MAYQAEMHDERKRLEFVRPPASGVELERETAREADEEERTRGDWERWCGSRVCSREMRGNTYDSEKACNCS